jgi:transposase
LPDIDSDKSRRRNPFFTSPSAAGSIPKSALNSPGAKGAKPVIPGRKSRKRKIRFDRNRYKFRWMVEAVFCRLKDFRRVATRYDKLARNYLETLTIATIVAYWL